MRRLALALVALAALPARAAPARLKVAVMDIASIQGVAAGTATILSEFVATEFARAGFDVISRSDIAAMIGFEKQKQVLGCQEDSRCLAEIGGALGVDFMLTGQVGQIGSQYRIALLLVDTRKAKVSARSAQFCERNEDALVRAAQERVADLVSGIRADRRPPAISRAPEAAPHSPGVAAAATSTVPAPEPPGGAFRTMPSGAKWAFAASGLCLVGSALFGIGAKNRYDELKKLQGTPEFDAAYATKGRDAKRLAASADALLVVGIGTAGVATWLWLRRPEPLTLVPVPVSGGAVLAASGSF